MRPQFRQNYKLDNSFTGKGVIAGETAQNFFGFSENIVFMCANGAQTFFGLNEPWWRAYRTYSDKTSEHTYEDEAFKFKQFNESRSISVQEFSKTDSLDERFQDNGSISRHNDTIAVRYTHNHYEMKTRFADFNTLLNPKHAVSFARRGDVLELRYDRKFVQTERGTLRAGFLIQDNADGGMRNADGSVIIGKFSYSSHALIDGCYADPRRFFGIGKYIGQQFSGVIFWLNGCIFTGTMEREGKLTGLGTLHFPSGISLEGRFEAGEMIGGKIKNKDKVVNFTPKSADYQKEMALFNENKPYYFKEPGQDLLIEHGGFAIQMNPSRHVFGQYKGDFIGKAIVFEHSGDVYFGGFQAGKRAEYGICVELTDQITTCAYNDGQMHGDMEVYQQYSICISRFEKDQKLNEKLVTETGLIIQTDMTNKTSFQFIYQDGMALNMFQEKQKLCLDVDKQFGDQSVSQCQIGTLKFKGSVVEIGEDKYMHNLCIVNTHNGTVYGRFSQGALQFGVIEFKNGMFGTIQGSTAQIYHPNGLITQQVQVGENCNILLAATGKQQLVGGSYEGGFDYNFAYYGPSTLKTQDGVVCVGTFKDGAFLQGERKTEMESNVGKFYRGSLYEGEFINQTTKIVGQFKDGVAHGDCEQQENNRVVKSGFFENGDMLFWKYDIQNEQNYSQGYFRDRNKKFGPHMQQITTGTETKFDYTMFYDDLPLTYRAEPQYEDRANCYFRFQDEYFKNDTLDPNFQFFATHYKNGQMNGRCFLTTPMYSKQGEFKNNKLDGLGIFSDLKMVYVGQFREDKKHGFILEGPVGQPQKEYILKQYVNDFEKESTVEQNIIKLVYDFVGESTVKHPRGYLSFDKKTSIGTMMVLPQFMLVNGVFNEDTQVFISACRCKFLTGAEFFGFLNENFEPMTSRSCLVLSCNGTFSFTKRFGGKIQISEFTQDILRQYSPDQDNNIDIDTLILFGNRFDGNWSKCVTAHSLLNDKQIRIEYFSGSLFYFQKLGPVVIDALQYDLIDGKSKTANVKYRMNNIWNDAVLDELHHPIYLETDFEREGDIDGNGTLIQGEIRTTNTVFRGQFWDNKPHGFCQQFDINNNIEEVVREGLFYQGEFVLGSYNYDELGHWYGIFIDGKRHGLHEHQGELSAYKIFYFGEELLPESVVSLKEDEHHYVQQQNTRFFFYKQLDGSSYKFCSRQDEEGDQDRCDVTYFQELYGGFVNGQLTGAGAKLINGALFSGEFVGGERHGYIVCDGVWYQYERDLAVSFGPQVMDEYCSNIRGEITKQRDFTQIFDKTYSKLTVVFKNGQIFEGLSRDGQQYAGCVKTQHLNGNKGFAEVDENYQINGRFYQLKATGVAKHGYLNEITGIFQGWAQHLNMFRRGRFSGADCIILERQLLFIQKNFKIAEDDPGWRTVVYAQPQNIGNISIDRIKYRVDDKKNVVKKQKGWIWIQGQKKEIEVVKVVKDQYWFAVE